MRHRFPSVTASHLPVCSGLDCPPLSSLRETEHYELRQYDSCELGAAAAGRRVRPRNTTKQPHSQRHDMAPCALP